jgi:surfeit locus 1 family protein
VTIAAVIVFVLAGNWQHRRMLEKEALRAQLDAASAAAPMALPAAVGDWTALRYRPLVLSGHYDAAHQVLIDNRVDAGRVGFHVITPLVLDDGRAVLVNRGFVAGGARREDVPAVPVPAGAQQVRGRVALPDRYVELGAAAPVGAVWQNLDPARFAAATGVAVLPVIVEQDAGDGGADGLVRHWPAPDLGIDRHKIYMAQWYLFAALAAGLWLFFTFRRRQ